jgi:hypothetical protein
VGFSKGVLESDTDEHSELLISKVIAPALKPAQVTLPARITDFGYKFSRPKRSTRAIQTSSFKNLSSRPPYTESVIFPVV